MTDDKIHASKKIMDEYLTKIASGVNTAIEAFIKKTGADPLNHVLRIKHTDDGFEYEIIQNTRPQAPSGDAQMECEACGGSGGQLVTIGVAGCCGNGLPSGECCGNAIEVPEQIEETCEYCGGDGVSKNAVSQSHLNGDAKKVLDALNKERENPDPVGKNYRLGVILETYAGTIRAALSQAQTNNESYEFDNGYEQGLRDGRYEANEFDRDLRNIVFGFLEKREQIEKGEEYTAQDIHDALVVYEQYLKNTQAQTVDLTDEKKNLLATIFSLMGTMKYIHEQAKANHNGALKVIEINARNALEKCQKDGKTLEEIRGRK